MFQKARQWQHQPHVRRYRLNDNGSNLLRVGAKELLYSIAIVVRGYQCILRGIGRHAGTVGQRHRCNAGACLYQQHIRVTMIAAAKLDNFIASGIGSGQA